MDTAITILAVLAVAAIAGWVGWMWGYTEGQHRGIQQQRRMNREDGC